LSPGSIVLLVYIIIATGIFIFSDVFLFYLAMRVFRKDMRIEKVSDVSANKLPDYKLPIITILLPLYKEKKTLSYLLRSILKSNYPKHKLDIRFLVEHDDPNTLRSIIALADRNKYQDGTSHNRYGVPKKIRICDLAIEIDYVYTGVRTKPNALNVGLRNAKGSLLTIYDAEDRPDPAQLRKVAAYMIKHPGVACVQSRLMYYNPDQSIITKFFTIEYIQQFLVLLPSLFSMNKVLLLGGTSNFFRTEVLRDVNGWDPNNVTEDADLGIRLSKMGYVTTPLDVITWEEAPPKLYTWIRQRVRWNKGFLYTLVVHFKHPRKLIHEIGLESTLFLFHTLFYPIFSAISLIGFILFAVYWIDWFGISLQPFSGWIHEAFDFSPFLLYTSLLTFAFGLFYSIFLALEGLFKQQDDDALKKVKYTFLLPLYQLLQGASSLVAIVELVLMPKVWHKTPHGFSIIDRSD
jgi:glycosyltransferase XagB